MTAVILEQETTQKVWYGCYDIGWGDNITSLSYSHPAKISRGLSIKIYQYALERGWLKPGDVVLDPFGGIGGTCLDALANGLSWVGCELERRFTDLGQGCDCTGISPAEWQEYNEQFKLDTIGQLNYKDNRHWCPACIAGAIQIKSNGLSDNRQPGLFDTAEDSCLPVPFKLAGDGTPYSLPHHYTGNLELFRKYARPGTFAVLLNGDSRYLRAVIGQAQRDGLFSSPPYAGSRIAQEGGNDAANIRRQSASGRYGSTDGQLGGMSEGNLADSLLSSPPYANGEKGHPSLGSVNKDNWGKDGRDIAGRRGLDGNYGGADGQLANMPLGDGLLSSPPFAGNTGGRGEASRNGIDAALFDRHSGGMKKGTGDNPANLDHLPMRGLADALLSSPPFEKSLAGEPRSDNSVLGQMQRGENNTKGGRFGKSLESTYSVDPNNLGSMSGGFDAALSSPPWSDSTGSDDPDKRGGLLKSDPKRRGDKNLTGSYGTSEGQLGMMPAGEFDGAVASPPFENSLQSQDVEFENKRQTARGRNINGYGHIGSLSTYGNTPANLGTEQGQTFWAAARQIVSEAWLCLKPGAVTFWVCKSFIRDGRMIDFPNQWRQLCEAVGFEYIESIHAMLVSQEQKQENLDGGSKTIRKERKSFFRRLAERNGSPRIDYEVVVILRKPENVV